MWIRRIAVENWRGLDADLADLAPGLNLVCGPNESGKSRLVQALRFALFESSSGRSRHKRDLEPWGVARGRPRVLVEFELAREHWQVEKVFLETGDNTRLRGPGTSLEGKAAEACLAELLGVQPAGSAEVRIEDAGIWSLLWVDQGRSREIPLQNPASQDRLQQRLGDEIGEAAAGETGQRILALAAEQRNRFFTAGRGDPRGTLKEPEQQLQELEERVRIARQQRADIADAADALAAAQVAERDLTARLAAATSRLDEITRRHREAAELGTALQLREAELRNAEAERTRCSAEQQRLRDLATEIERLGERERECLEHQAGAARAVQRAQRECDEAQRAVREAQGVLHELESGIEALRRRQMLTQLRTQLGELNERRGEALELGERITALRVGLAALPAVSAAEVDALRDCGNARDAARARLEGACASLELQALADIDLDGQPMPAQTARHWLIEDELHLEIGGVAVLSIRPGGGELVRLREVLADAERALDDKLAALQVPDTTEAQRVAQQRHDIARELQQLQQELARRIPEGRDELDDRVRELGAQYDALRGEAATDHDGRTFDPTELEQAQRAIRAAQQTLEDTRTRRDLTVQRHAALRDTLVTANANLAHVREQLDATRQRRAALPDVAALQQQTATAERTWQERLALRETAREHFDALGGSTLALELEQATQARGQLQRTLDDTRDRRIRLEETVRTASGNHEQVLELEAQLHEARQTFARLQREAAAAQRLHDVLYTEYVAARERLTRPVIDRIRPYLGDLFPGSEAWLDDDLTLLGLRSRDHEESFGALSGGAREQLSLLVRVGLAEVIGADDPFPLVLDDVLVNTDAERIARIQRLLYQASRHMQILLFTCHGPLFDTLGPDRRIELTERPRR